MKYADYSRDLLLSRIEELELLNRELLEENRQHTKLEYAWTGNLGHWYWNIKTNSVTFNPLKVTTLGYDTSDLTENVTYQFFTDKLHPEDYEKTMNAMKDHLYGKAAVYEAEYRMQTKTGNYKWFYDRGKITQFDENKKPLFLSGIVFDITEKKETQLDLEYKNRLLAEMSSVDGLTKIKNHRTLVEHLIAEVSEANRVGRPLSIALFDIDDFKKVNDSKGHLYGDQVLVDIAAIMQNSIRDTDLAGRYGGEEFLVIFTNADLAAASNIAERIRRAVEGISFPDGVQVTISGGIKQYEGENFAELIQAADKNLYEAKSRGKNLIVF